MFAVFASSELHFGVAKYQSPTPNCSRVHIQIRRPNAHLTPWERIGHSPNGEEFLLACHSLYDGTYWFS